MNEYLSKEALQEKLNRKKAGPATKRYTEGWNDALLMVKSMIHCEKAADVAPVRHGRWIDKGEYAVCMECGGRSGTQYDGVEPIPLMTQFCPNCGAKMDELVEENKE